MNTSSPCISKTQSGKPFQVSLLFSLTVLVFLLITISNVVSAAEPNRLKSLSPSGNGSELQPDFSWQPISGVAEYQLRIQQGRTQFLDEEISAEALGCDANDSEMCTYSPSFSLQVDTPVVWQVRVVDESGNFHQTRRGHRGHGGRGGHWSTAWYRVTTPAAPKTKTPRHTINEGSPTYTWNAVNSANSYELIIRSGGTSIFSGTISAIDAGCDESSVCSYMPDVSLNNGRYKWQVRGISDLGPGRWSRSRHFKVKDVVLTENQAPLAESGSVITDQDTSVAITLVASDADGDVLTYIVDETSANGGSVTGTAPAITYTPPTGFTGSDTFTFKVNDSVVDSDIATITVTVNAVNTAPIASGQMVAVDEDGSLEVVLIASDADGDALSFAIVTPPESGSLTGTPPNLTYEPSNDFNGSDSFTFVANDGILDSVEAVVNITVNSVNDLPTVSAGNDQIVDEGETLSLTGSASDIETDDTDLTFSWVQLSGPEISLVGANTETISFTAPDVDGEQTILFELMVSDGDGGTAADQVEVTVVSVNTPPLATEQSVSLDEDTSLAIMISGADADGDALSYSVATPPENGVLTGTAPNLTYQPNDDFSGSDSFTFIANDGLADSPEATVSITVNPIPEQAQNLVAIAGAGQVFLDWDAVDDADSYVVCIAAESLAGAINCPTSSGLGMPLVADTNSLLVDTTAYEDLMPGTEYFFIVFSAIDVDGSQVLGAVSNEVSATPEGIVQPTPTGRLNDTGITLCGDYAYDNSLMHQNNLDCTLTEDAEGDPVPAGQDGQIGRDVTDGDPSDGHAGFSFTKIDADGFALPADATEWSCVKDNVTGLVWEVKTDDGGLHDRDDTYQWYQTENNGGLNGFDGNENICFGYDAATETSWCNTTAFADRVNAQNLCGAGSGWRVPTMAELTSLVNYEALTPTIDTNYFPNTQYYPIPDHPNNRHYYWSSSPFIYYEDRAWIVGYTLGRNHSSGKDYKRYVRLVRGNQ